MPLLVRLATASREACNALLYRAGRCTAAFWKRGVSGATLARRLLCWAWSRRWRLWLYASVGLGVAGFTLGTLQAALGRLQHAVYLPALILPYNGNKGMLELLLLSFGECAETLFCAMSTDGLPLALLGFTAPVWVPPTTLLWLLAAAQHTSRRRR